MHFSPKLTLKFVYSEKATKFCEISNLLLSTVHTNKSKVEISQIFSTFSGYMNFKKHIFFRIERSRTIVPALIEAVEKCPKSKEINVDYFYKLLFTRHNLKLVHIVCHDKQVHCNKKCDTNSIYRPK